MPIQRPSMFISQQICIIKLTKSVHELLYTRIEHSSLSYQYVSYTSSALCLCDATHDPSREKSPTLTPCIPSKKAATPTEAQSMGSLHRVAGVDFLTGGTMDP